MKYLIAFPGPAMDLSDVDIAQVSVDSHAVIDELKQAGVYVFGGGIDESVKPVLVGRDGSVREGSYPEFERIAGGFLVIEAPSRQAALGWAAKVAAACRCAQEVRAFGYDPAS